MLRGRVRFTTRCTELVPATTARKGRFSTINSHTDSIDLNKPDARFLARPGVLIPLIAIVVMAAIAFGAMQWTEIRLRRVANIDLLSERELISNSLDRLRHLPVAVAHHPYVIASLSDVAAPGSDAQEQVDLLSNRYLQTVSEASGASLLYVIDVEGLTRAANNWQDTGSLVGNRFRFRPYFQRAMQGEEARYFAIGVTTREAGYYFAQPVRNESSIVGVAVAKLELESLQRQWQEKKPHSLLIDEHGVVILSSNPDWRYRQTRALSNEQLGELASQQKYSDQALHALNTNSDIMFPRLRIDGSTYLSSTVPLPLQTWQLVQLTPIAPVYNSGIVAALVSGLLVGLSALIFLYRRERQRKNLLSVAAQEAARMRSMNQELQAQIGERRKAEQHLQEAQAELIQASKLAALGQMSAAIAHEVNQPLSAIRTFSASTKVLLERDRMVEAHKNLDEIQALTERLAILTYDLKTFARKSDVPRESVSLQDCVKRVVGTLKPDLQEKSITLNVSAPELPVYVVGNAIRIEQVLSNLIRNAMDAATDVTDRGVVDLSVCREQDEAVVRVQDNGCGLSDDDASHVFEPFFTTKPMGEGVGLGLSIAFGIVEEMGGQLRVRNSSQGGAMFSVRFPCQSEDMP